MLHIILLILKIIGIILLCILGILILSVLCLLFVPARYRIEVTREEGEDKPPVLAYVKVTWLLHLFNILVSYPADVILRVRIMLFTVFRLPKKEAQAGTGHKERKKKKGTKPEKKQNEESGPDEKTMEDSSENSGEIPSGGGTVQTVPDRQENAKDDLDTGEARQEAKASLFVKIRRIVDKIKQIAVKVKEFFGNIQYTIRKFCDKMKAALDNIEYYQEALAGEPFRQSWQLCKEEISSVMKALKPDKFEADLIIGMEDPAALGEILAAWGMMYPLVGRHIRIVGDFECGRTRVEGSIYIQGKLRAFTFLKTALRIYFNKDIKVFIKQLKKEAA